MTPEPIRDVAHLRDTPLGKAGLWVTPSVRERVRAVLPFPILSPDEALPADLETLVVVGGGTLIDRAKSVARDHGRSVRLIAVPSIWGSGAEVSPIIVLDDAGRKTIRIDARYLPDRYLHWPELADTVDPGRAREACGDTVAHALEGFLSPLASEEVRADLAAVIREIAQLPIGNDARWFDVSARACAGQSRSSVGLVHGIAHVLESILRARHPADGWGHARLCSLFLWPVMEFNRQASEKWHELTSVYGIDSEAVFALLPRLSDVEQYRQAHAVLLDNWPAVLRDPCTRTNCVLVRPASLEFFRSRGTR